MISYHLNPVNFGAASFSAKFKAADTNSPARVARCAKSYVWSPIIWKDGVRKQSHFARCDWLVLDFDDGELTLAQARKDFCDMEGFIGTTRSHQEIKNNIRCDRFRVALRFCKPIFDLRVYRWNMHRILANYSCDKSCKDGARFFYPCTEIVEVWEGKDYAHHDVDISVPEIFDKPNLHEIYARNGVVPPWTAHMLSVVIPIGERNTTIYRVAKDLYKIGMTAEEILVRVLQSATYSSLTISHDLSHELREVIRSGVRKAYQEIKQSQGEDE